MDRTTNLDIDLLRAFVTVVEAGSFTIRVGQSSADLPLSASVSRSTTLMLPV